MVRIRKKSARRATWTCSLALLFACVRGGQTTSTTLLGTVTDPSGAPVAGVEIAATHVATNQVRNTITNDQGYFVLPALTLASTDSLRGSRASRRRCGPVSFCKSING